MVLAGDENFIARTALDAQSIAGLSIGQELAVLAGDLTLTGKLAAIAPEPLPDLSDGPRYVVDVLVPRPQNGDLLVGQGVRLKLP